MTSKALQLTEIQHHLSLLPLDKLQQARDFITFLYEKASVSKQGIVSLEGVWKGAGFEKLNLEDELKAARSAHTTKILNKVY